MNINPSVDEIMSDIINSKRDMIVEDAVDEYLLAEKDIMIEATTAANRMVDIAIDKDDSQYIEDIEDDEEVNEFIDSHIDNISVEGEEFQDTLDEFGLDEDDSVIENLGEILDEDLPYDDLESMIDDGNDIDYIINK